MQSSMGRDKSEVGNIAVQKWREGREGDDLVRLTKETLRGRLRAELYEYVRAFTKIGRSRTGACKKTKKRERNTTVIVRYSPRKKGEIGKSVVLTHVDMRAAALT